MATAKATTITKTEITGVTLNLTLHEARFLYSIYNMIGNPGSSRDGALLSVHRTLREIGIEKLESPSDVWETNVVYPSLSEKFARLADQEVND